MTPLTTLSSINKDTILSDYCLKSVSKFTIEGTPFFKCSHETMFPVLFGAVKFFNIDMLISLSATSKQFQKRKDVKYVINSQLRFLVITGLSTMDRLKFWNHRTRFAFYRRKY